MKFVVSSDWHLDARTGGMERREEIKRAVMDGPVKAAIEGKADAFLFGGDLCDPGGRSAVHDVAFPIEVARALAYEGIPSFWIPGNHDVVLIDETRTTLDALYAASWAIRSEKDVGMVSVSTGPSVCMVVHPNGAEFRVASLPYSHREERRSFEGSGLKALDVTNNGPLILLAHCTDFPGAAAGSEALEFSRGRGQPFPRELLPQCALAFNGHLHEPQVIDYAEGKVHVPGSLVRLTFGDSARERGFIIAELPG